jgi:hypothetical protein
MRVRYDLPNGDSHDSIAEHRPHRGDLVLDLPETEGSRWIIGDVFWPIVPNPSGPEVTANLIPATDGPPGSETPTLGRSRGISRGRVVDGT